MIRIGMFIDDRYEILERIGSGGMSDVYKAKDHKLNRYVAIKFLKKEFCSDSNFVSKFKIEAQNAAALLHPNVVSVYDVNDYEGIYYIVMEYVDGITLKEYIEKNGRLPVKEATSIAIQVAQGIEAAHNANIIHRDIKPQNVLISREGKIKVTDFGIARTTTANTMSQDVLGSVHYISPEQARGGVVAERSDIYSFGILFYEMVTGQLPYEGDSTVSIALKHIQENVPLASEVAPSTPSSVVKIIEKCTQRKPERRYQKVSSLISDLKTSLITPNDDFVVLEPETADNATILMSGSEARYLREEGERADKNFGNTNPVRYNRKNTGNTENIRGGYDRQAPRRNFDKVLKFAGIAAAIIVVIILVIISIKSFGLGGNCGGSSRQEITQNEMIDVVGKNINVAKEELAQINIKNITFEYENSSEVEKDCVTKQSVAPGTMVEASTPVVLTISSGKEEITLDDYSGLRLSEVQKLLENMGLKTRVVTTFDEKVDTGKVIKTDPAARSKVAAGDTVVIYVSKGEEVKKIKVPELVGYQEAYAVELLNTAKLEYFIQYVEDNNNVGYVIYQSEEPGSEVPDDTVVGIAVAIAAETVAPETQPAETEAETTAAAETETQADTQAAETTQEQQTEAENNNGGENP